MTSFQRTRILLSLVLGLFVLTASAMAEVTYDSAAGTFTGDGTYSETVNASKNLTATPTTGQTITFTNNIVSTGNFTQTGENLVFGAGTVNSFNVLYINNGSGNGAKMTLSGSMTLTELHIANVRTTYLDITDGAALSVSGKAWVNEAKNAQGIITQTGGTVSFTTSGATDVRIGHWPNTGYPSRYNISGGTLSIPNTITYVGWDGYAEMNISGGEVSLKGLSLSNNANGKGTLRLTGGTLNIGDGGIVRNKRNASSSASAEVYLGQGTIHATATQTWGSNLTLSLTGRSATDTADVAGGVTTFNVDEGKTITIPSAISGVGALTKTGAGTLTLGGNVKTTGEITVSDGTLALTAPGAVQNSSAIANNSAITASADQTFKNLSGNGTVTFSNNGFLTLSNSAQTAFSGSITGLKGLTVSGTGALDLSSATISPVAEFETKAGANVNISSEKPVSVSNTFRQNDTTVFTLSGGTASISGANAAQQATIALNGGTMSFNYQAPALPDYAGLAVHLDASNANSFDNSSSITTWYNLADSNNNLTFTGYKNSTSHAYVTEAKQNGLNVMTFPTNGTAYYDMKSVVNGKTFFAVMADNGNTSSSDYSFLFGNKSDGSVNGHNPYCFHRGAGTVLWNTSHLDGNIKNGGVTTLNGTAVDHADANIGTGWNVLSIQATGAVPVSAISRERTSLTAARGWRGDIAEILVFTEILTDEQVKAVNQYLATKWNVGADVVTVPTSDSFVSANAINVLADSTIDVGEFASVTFGSTSIDEGKTLTVNVAEGQETVWTSPISGDGSFTKSGLGSLTLSEVPDYAGSTTVEAGTLALTEGGTLNNLSGGSLNPDGSIAQSAVLDATGKDLTLTNSETTKFIGSITANNLVVDGEGLLQIYTGAEGKVDVQSLVVSSGNLDFKGYMNGSIVVESDTVFSPGNSVGESTFTGSFTLEDAATLLIEQDATGMDKLTASSYVIDPNSILELTVGAAAPGATYAIIVRKDGDNPVNFEGDLATDEFWNSLLTDDSAYYWHLSVNGNVVSATLDANAVPEPSTWALLVLGVAIWSATARRRFHYQRRR